MTSAGRRPNGTLILQRRWQVGRSNVDLRSSTTRHVVAFALALLPLALARVEDCMLELFHVAILLSTSQVSFDGIDEVLVVMLRLVLFKYLLGLVILRELDGLSRLFFLWHDVE